MVSSYDKDDTIFAKDRRNVLNLKTADSWLD